MPNQPTSNRTITSSDRALCHLTCDDAEAAQLEDTRKEYGGIFQYDDVLVYISAFLTDKELMQLTGASAALLFYRYQLSLDRSYQLPLRDRTSLHKYRFNNFTSSEPFTSSTDNDFTLNMDNKNSKIHGIAISPCENYIVAVYTCEIVVWNNKTGERLKILDHHASAYGPKTIAFSADAKQIAFFDYGDFKIFDRETLRIHISHINFGFVIYCDNENFISSDNNILKIWDWKSKSCIQTFIGQAGNFEDRVFAIHILREYRWLISGSLDKTIKIWDINTGNCLWIFREFNELTVSIAVSPNKKYVVAGSCNGKFAIWDMESKRLLQAFVGYYDRNFDTLALPRIEGIVISNDSKYFISVANWTLKIWEIETGKQVGEKILKNTPTAFCSKGEKIVIGFHDDTIQQFSFASLPRGFKNEMPVLKIERNLAHSATSTLWNSNRKRSREALSDEEIMLSP